MTEINLGTSLESIDRAIWKRINDKISIPSEYSKEVLQQQPDFKKGNQRDFDCKFNLKRITITEIKERAGKENILIPNGIASVTLPTGEVLQGPAEYLEYEKVNWYKILYQCSYMANSLKVDRICSEGILRLISRDYIETDPGCKVFIRVFDSLKSIISDPNMEIFERAITWEVEAPLHVEKIGIVPAIISHNYEIVPVNKLPTEV